MAHPNIQQGMIGLPDVIGLFGLVSVEQIVSGPVGVTALMGQRQQSGVKLLYDPIDPMIIGNGPSVVLCHVTDLSVDKGRSGWRFMQREPFDELSQFGWQSVRLSSVPASVPGEPG